MKPNELLPLGMAFLSALLFAIATPFSKLLLDGIGPIALAGLLYAGAALGVLPVVARERRLRAPRLNYSRANRFRLGGAILCGGVLGPIFYLIGLRLAAATSVSLWLNLELVATAVLGHLFFRDHLGRFAWLGVAGVVISGALLSRGGASELQAAFFVALGCLMWGLDNHLTALIDGITPARSTLWKGTVAGLFNIALATQLEVGSPSVTDVAFAIFLGAVSYGVSITLYIGSAQQLGATRAQIVFASSPFIGALLSALLLREPVGIVHAGVLVLLVTSIAFILRDRLMHVHEHAHEYTEHEHSHIHDDGHHEHVHPETPAATRHSHPHVHPALRHSHPHWPDLHHRHGHEG